MRGRGWNSTQPPFPPSFPLGTRLCGRDDPLLVYQFLHSMRMWISFLFSSSHLRWPALEFRNNMLWRYAEHKGKSFFLACLVLGPLQSFEVENAKPNISWRDLNEICKRAGETRAGPKQSLIQVSTFGTLYFRARNFAARNTIHYDTFDTDHWAERRYSASRYRRGKGRVLLFSSCFNGNVNLFW